MWVLGIESSLLEEWPMLLSTELSLQTLNKRFFADSQLLEAELRIPISGSSF